METRDTNETYGKTLLRLAEKYPELVVLEADLGKASGSVPFKDGCSRQDTFCIHIRKLHVPACA